VDPLGAFRIENDVLQRIAELEDFKGRWQALQRIAPDRLTSLRRAATCESIGSSTRIEGATMSDAEVLELLEGLEIRSFTTRSEQEVAGYARAMELVFDAWPDLALTENHLKQLHGTLLRFSEKDQRHRGEYKTMPNHVEAFDENGASLGIVFRTSEPFETPFAMERLVGWTSAALAGGAPHPLLVIAVFVVRFLAIHPFQDGNGRLSRVLTTLLLVRAGYDYVPYSSMERVVEQNNSSYYRALRSAQSTLDGDESRLGDWIRFFLRCMVQQKNNLASRLEEERALEPTTPIASALLDLARRRGRFTLRGAVTATGANRNTMKVHVRRLVAGNQLVQRGVGRGTWYEMPGPGKPDRPPPAPG
jgi:Fic family protein